MKQSSSSEANQFSACQKLRRILGNQKVHYCVYKWPPPVPVLSQINPVHSSQLSSWSSIFTVSTPESSKWSISLRFHHQIPIHTCPLHHCCYMPQPLQFLMKTFILIATFLFCCYMLTQNNDSTTSISQNFIWQPATNKHHSHNCRFILYCTKYPASTWKFSFPVS
jgi:hypothetical protein